MIFMFLVALQARDAKADPMIHKKMDVGQIRFQI